MAIEDALSALPGHLDDVLAQLGPEQAAELGELIGRLSEHGDDREARAGLSALLVTGLSARHPVRRALAGGYLLAPSAIDAVAVAAGLRARLEVTTAAAALSVVLPSSGDPSADPPTVSEILQTVTARLLSAPAYDADEVRRHGASPEDQALIRLRRPDGRPQWPTFQFGPGQAGALPVVRDINQLLGAAADPVGVADWWLSTNGWLGVPPRELLGRGADDQLISAARAVGTVA